MIPTVFLSLSRLVHARRTWYGLWALLFVALVACGLTVSNLGCLRGSSLTVLVGEEKLAGSYRPIRSDEYVAHGLMPAIQQFTAEPRFPRINDRLGMVGRNYLLLHDTGAPIRHISMIGRPAVWGFFFLDLRRALSWFSLLPVFFSVFAFWFLFDTLCRENGAVNFLAALACVFTLNSSVWTFWPAYNVSGSCLGAAALLRLLRAERRRDMLAWGLLVGWGGLVSALTVYFPRVWYGALFVGAVTLGACFRDRLWARFRSSSRLCALALGLLFFVGILALWADGCGDAIDLMLNATYPGLRRDGGGSFTAGDLFGGWIAALVSLKNEFCRTSNQCEIQAPFFMMSPILICICLVFRRMRRELVLALLGYAVFMYLLCYCGFPNWFMRLTLLDRGNHGRADYFLSVVQIALLASLWSSASHVSFLKVGSTGRRVVLWGLAGLLIALPAVSLWGFSSDVLGEMRLCPSRTPWTLRVLAMLLAYFVLALTLLFRFRVGCVLFLLFEIAWGVRFNPLCRAPTEIESPLLSRLQRESDGWRYGGRVLFDGPPAEANLYVAAGGRSYAGFFEYEDREIFERLLADLPDAAEFHRLNHLLVCLRSDANKPFMADVPSPDVIRLTFDALRYDFSALPIDYVVSQDPSAVRGLRVNPSVRKIDTMGPWKIYQVRKR